jgi:very-short-patch-repair endonuclease
MGKRLMPYNIKLKDRARSLRNNMTEGEQALWSKLRGKQILGFQFYRQKPLGNYILDFYAPKAKLVVEVDGSQHAETAHAGKDKERDQYLANLGLKVLRFNSREVLVNTEAVVQTIYDAVKSRVN